ncbi:hypothetical protein JMUB7519_28090 [Staphylococcus aureus]
MTYNKDARDANNQATATKRQKISSIREATQEDKTAAVNE